MRAHHLIGQLTDPVRVAGDICGLHAQLMPSAELSVWARAGELDRDAVSAALWTHRTLVKLWAARGALHLLPSKELGVWLSALGTQTKFGNAGNQKIDELVDVVGQALDGQVLTRTELAAEVERISGSPLFGEWIRSSWGPYLKAASFRGRVCFASSQGIQVRFTTPDTWIREKIRKPESAEALRDITRRFLAAYAPATPEDLTRWWFGPPVPTRGMKMIAALGEEAVAVDVEGRRAWVLAADLPDMLSADTPDVARLLPAFDPWVIGAARHAPLLDPAQVTRVFRKQGWISPVLLVNGRIAGVWKHLRTGRRLSVELEPFGKLPPWAHTQLQAQVCRLADFLDAELV